MAGDIDRFWSRVDVRGPTECWEWTGRLVSGYGHTWFQGKHAYAHRIAAFLAGLVGSVSAPTDKTATGFVLHTCDNRKCRNKKHFVIGTYKQNADHMHSRGRAPNHSGATNPNAIFSETQIVEIKAAYKAGSTQQKIADAYGVDRSTIGYIVRGDHYA